MSRKISKLEASRQKGAHQVDDQRANILDAAEKLFLEKGLEQTSMSDIAAEADLSRVSLYRYFPDLHPIAFEIAARMLQQIYGSITAGEANFDLALARKMMIAAINQFYELRDAYRFLGMFDQLYGAGYPTEELAAWYKEQVGVGMLNIQNGATDIAPEQIAMIGNCVMSFLQKLAARGDLMAEEQGVSLNTQLALLKDMVNVYFDHLATVNQR
ncbi:MAG: TetR/AcrR family transcriptional regulator [Ardenticatenaceae bacterium]|nr:TetR/AcrR family transcriptional regulator [Ardenticatenaceae bacterium]